MFTIFKKEVNQFLNSLLGYMVLVIFLVATGLLFWVFPESNVLDYGFAEMAGFFGLTPFVFIFLIPAITMRSFAEEKKSGTLEWLLTKPLSEWDILLGKFFACLFLVFLSLVPTLIYFVSLWVLGAPQGNIDSAGVFGSYFGLFMLASVFSAIGIFGSSITDNQLVAFVLSVFICFLMYSGISSIASIDVWSSASSVIQYFGLDFHYQALGKGLIDLRDVLFFVSTTTVLLFATRLVLNSRRW
jgi:ABC-2 type transport system permease protein